MNLVKLRQQKGFTLTEMIIVIFLFSVLLLGLLNIFDWQQKVYNLEQADIAATGSARNVMNNMTFALAQGSSLISSRNINGIDYTTGGGSIVIQVPAYDVSGNWIPSEFDYYVYTADDNELFEIIDASANSARESSTKLLTESLETFALTYNNGNPTAASQVSVNLTTRAFYRGNQSVSVNLQETIFLRNR